MTLPEQKSVIPADIDPLNKIARSVIREQQRFGRLEISKDDLLLMFEDNPFKKQII